jgi:hypothetical protein
VSRDVTEDVNFICDKTVVFGVAIKETSSRSRIGKPQAADHMRQSLPFGAALEHRTSLKNFSFMNRKTGWGGGGEKGEEKNFT